MPHDQALEEAEEVVRREASHYHWNVPGASAVAEVLDCSLWSEEASLKGELAGRPCKKQVKLYFRFLEKLPHCRGEKKYVLADRYPLTPSRRMIVRIVTRDSEVQELLIV